MNSSKTQALVQQVWGRQWLAAVASRFQLFLLILGAFYALLLLTSRLLGVIPNVFDPRTIAALPLAALALAMIFHRRPQTTDCARLIDARARTDDLFLTTVLIDKTLGEYQPLVIRQAEERAVSVAARDVVRFQWWPGTRKAVVVLGMLTLGVFYLPQMDPFGKEKERQKLEKKKQELAESRKAVEQRAAILAQKNLDAPNSPEVATAIAQLKQAFNELKPIDPKGNLAKLAAEQKDLGKMWREIGEQKLKDMSSPNPAEQKFGSGDVKKLAEWREELAKGKVDSLERELAQLKKMAQELAEKPEGAEKDKERQELKERLKTLADFIAESTNSPQTKAAVQRALEDLDASKLNNISKEALQGLKESLGLTEKELRDLSQAARDMKQIEEAIKAIQLAKMLQSGDHKSGFA